MVGEDALSYHAGEPAGGERDHLAEATLTALWLLGRVPEAAFPVGDLCGVLRPGRAGRGPGPDVREATLLLASGVSRTGDVEVHLRASDFARHGHGTDPAYGGVVLHLCWQDDRPAAPRAGQGSDCGAPAGWAGGPTPLPGGGQAPTLVLGPLLDVRRVEALVARGPSGAEPCADASARLGAAATEEIVRAEGRRRLAERSWRAWRLADRYGFEGAFRMLLERALASTAGRAREGEERRAALLAGILAGLGADPVAGLAEAGRGGTPAALITTMRTPPADRTPPLGAARAAEVAWNAALPLLAALAAAYGDVALARATAALAERWPPPRPYGRTRSLAGHLAGRGALHAQGLLHLQDLWCTRGGCGVCPLS